MPVLRKRNHWHGLALECLRRTRTRFSALCYAVCYLVHHRHNKPRLRPIRCHSWRVYSTLSTFASLCLYNTTLFSPKTCKVSKEKAAVAGRRLFIIKLPPYSLALFLLSSIFILPFFYERLVQSLFCCFSCFRGFFNRIKVSELKFLAAKANIRAILSASLTI